MGGDAATLAALTGMDPAQAAILLDAAGGDMEMAVSLHFGDQADAELYWDESGDDLDGEQAPRQRGAREAAAQLVNRVQGRQERAQKGGAAAAAAARRAKKSRAQARREEAEALILVGEPADEQAGRPPRDADGRAAAAHGGVVAAVGAAGADSGTSGDERSDGESESDDDRAASSSEEEWVDDDWEPRSDECLFDGHISASFEANCEYMQRTHSFFVPYTKYLVDAEGLFAYLQEKIYSYHTCIYCNRAFVDLEAVRKHMKDKSHCKVNFEDDDGALELSEFYNFGKSWMARRAFRRAAFRNSDTSGENPELVLPNGTRLGHRSLLRQYRQKPHHSLGIAVRQNRSESHRYMQYAHHRRPPRADGTAVAQAYSHLELGLAQRREQRANNALLLRAANVAGGNSKALPGQYTFKADFADNAARRAIVHHWGAFRRLACSWVLCACRGPSRATRPTSPHNPCTPCNPPYLLPTPTGPTRATLSPYGARVCVSPKA
jgi:hypothetical protein